MQDVVRDGMKAGALGLSVSRNKGHFDPQGVHIPALWADEKEIFALADVLREHGHRHRSSAAAATYAELKDGMMRRLVRGDRPHRRLQQPGQTMRRPDEWKKHMARVDETTAPRASAPIRCAARTG